MDRKDYDKMKTKGVRGRGGFYGRVLDKAGRKELKEAAEVEGVAEEIKVLRVKLRRFAREHPEEMEECLAAAGMINRLVKTHYAMTKEQKKGFKEALKRMLVEVGIPIGGAVAKAVAD